MLYLLRTVSLRQLMTGWGRTILVIAGIANGVTLIAAISIINASVLTNLRHVLELLAGPAALEVTLSGGEVGFPEATLEEVRRDPEVALAVPLVRGTIALADRPGTALELFGADLAAEADLERYPIVAASDRRELVKVMEDSRAILITTDFASEHGVRVGEALHISTPTGLVVCTVRGLIEARGIARVLGGALAVMDLPAAQALLGKPTRVDQIDVILRAGANPDRVRDRLQQSLLPTLRVATPAERGREVTGMLDAYQALLTGLSLLSLLVGIYIIYNTTHTSAVHRAVVMTELQVLGAEPRQLFALLMIEALVLGVIGTLLGLASGYVLARLLIAMVADAMGVVFQLRFPVATLVSGVRDQIAIGALGIGAALIASASAARHVAGLEPLRLMRGTSADADVQPSVPRLVALWCVLVLASAAALMLEVRWHSIAWGNVGSTLWNGSVFVIAIPVVTWSAVVLRRLLPRLFGVVGSVSLASLFRAPTRTGVTVAAVAGVLTLSMTLASLAVSHRESVAEYVHSGWLASDLVVSAVTTSGGWLETPVPAALVAEVRGLPGIAGAAAIRILPGQRYRGERLTIVGLDTALLDPVHYPARWYREGGAVEAAAALARGAGVNVSTALADRFGLRLGDELALETPGGILRLPIVGVVYDYTSDRGSVLLAREMVASWWHDDGANRINVYLAPGGSVDSVRGEIQAHFGDRYRLKVLELGEAVRYLADAIDRAFTFTDAIQLLLIIVTVAGIFDLLVARIVERRRELAEWRVVGATDRDVRRAIVIEAVTIGALGVVLGIPVGLVTAWIWTAINYRYLLGYYLTYHLPVGTIVSSVVLVFAMAVIAGYAAAVQATRVSTLEGIQAD